MARDTHSYLICRNTALEIPNVMRMTWSEKRFRDSFLNLWFGARDRARPSEFPRHNRPHSYLTFLASSQPWGDVIWSQLPARYHSNFRPSSEIWRILGTINNGKRRPSASKPSSNKWGAFLATEGDPQERHPSQSFQGQRYKMVNGGDGERSPCDRLRGRKVWIPRKGWIEVLKRIELVLSRARVDEVDCLKDP